MKQKQQKQQKQVPWRSDQMRSDQIDGSIDRVRKRKEGEEKKKGRREVFCVTPKAQLSV
jgi:hypothetical protein